MMGKERRQEEERKRGTNGWEAGRLGSWEADISKLDTPILQYSNPPKTSLGVQSS